MITFRWQWYGTGPALTESESGRGQAAAAACGEAGLTGVRIIADREPEAGQ